LFTKRPEISDRVIRVVHITFGLDVGGQEKLLGEFARQADRDQFELRFVSLGSRGVLATDIEALGWPVTALAMESGLRPRLIMKLFTIFRRWRPDVTHTHDARALFYAGPAAWLSGVRRSIHTRHGKNFGSTPRQVAVGRQLARLVDRYVCVSDDVKAQCVAEGISPSRLLTIKNGIDLERFAYSGSVPGGPIVAVARLSPEKDVANLVRATAIAARQIPSLQVEVAGAGSCLEDLKHLAASLSIANRITFLGEVRDVTSVLARARMFVLPSRSEGIPLTTLEAMACGLPVVATRVGGLPEVVDHGVTGLLVPPGDPAALAEAVARLWNDPARRERMGSAGAQRALELFDIRRMVAQYQALYRGENSGDIESYHRRSVKSTAHVPAGAEAGTE
jgi:glycosyltransferase involved in cell wall biosynthesis